MRMQHYWHYNKYFNHEMLNCCLQHQHYVFVLGFRLLYGKPLLFLPNFQVVNASICGYKSSDFNPTLTSSNFNPTLSYPYSNPNPDPTLTKPLSNLNPTSPHSINKQRVWVPLQAAMRPLWQEVGSCRVWLEGTSLIVWRHQVTLRYAPEQGVGYQVGVPSTCCFWR